LGKCFLRTLRHFWPGLNGWADQMPDTRFQEMVTYEARFLLWWGLLLFCFKLGSRRDLDYKLRDLELCVLDNANRLAQTEQESLPVHKTLDHFLGHVGSEGVAALRHQCVRRLIRNKVFDRFRFNGEFVIATDGTGYLVFKDRHCPHCLEHKRSHIVHALICEETVEGQIQTYAWITNKRLSAANVVSVATNAGRVRFKIENQGFNIQKNSGLNLEHAYSLGTDTLKCYYYLLQIAHLFLQMLEMGSLLQQLARQYGSTPLALFGSLKNIAQFLLDCFRYFRMETEVFNPTAAFQIRLVDSS
jgi:hypothetical protein